MAFRWAFRPGPTRDCPSLDPDQRALDQMRFIRYAAKPTRVACFFWQYVECHRRHLPRTALHAPQVTITSQVISTAKPPARI